jgi:hypothetical protein
MLPLQRCTLPISSHVAPSPHATTLAAAKEAGPSDAAASTARPRPDNATILCTGPGGISIARPVASSTPMNGVHHHRPDPNDNDSVRRFNRPIRCLKRPERAPTSPLEVRGDLPPPLPPPTTLICLKCSEICLKFSEFQDSFCLKCSNVWNTWLF